MFSSTSLHRLREEEKMQKVKIGQDKLDTVFRSQNHETLLLSGQPSGVKGNNENMQPTSTLGGITA